MQSIFFLFIFVVSFCCGAFAQNVSDAVVSTESSGKSLDTSSSSTGAMDTEVVPKADIPEAGEPASSYKGDESYGSDDSDLPSKENLPSDAKGLVTDDGTTAAGDYEKAPKGEPDSDVDYDLRQLPPKQSAVSAGTPGSDVDADTNALGSGADTLAPAKSQSSDTYGE